MTPFLQQVARHYIDKGGMEGCCFLFPNRRSEVFFKKYLGEEVKRKGTPMVAPKMLTINDFFFKASGCGTAGRITLLLELYRCYKDLNRNAEPLDTFVFWGDVILGDFDYVDKYRVDPRQLFTDVSDFKGIQDSFSYLTEKQRNAIGRFVSHFFTDGRLTVDPDSDNPNVKERFLQVWNLLFPLYTRFRENLSRKGLVYEGMVYRSLADRLASESVADVLRAAFPGTSLFVFVGLNALNECEKAVMLKMRDAGFAEFCWDFKSEMIRDPRNRSSFFLSRNMEMFRNSFETDPEGLDVPEVEVISVPSSVGQAKLLPLIAKDEDYAVVLPDESLLVSVLNSIPPEIGDVNVTMGCPMGNSAFYDFFRQVSAMQMHLREKDGRWYFYHARVWSVFSSGVFRRIIRGDKAAQEKVKSVKGGAQYYISETELTGHPVFDLIFRPVATAPKEASLRQVLALAEYQKNLIRGMAERLSDDGILAVELAFAKEAYQAVNMLQESALEVLPGTYLRLLDQLLATASVPFNGEPLKGLQVMGPLETRALDFSKVVILSCNEGTFPRRSFNSSFIPPELRKGFGLPTYEYQDAVQAYYFYRMIQRAEKVYLVYDSRTEGIKTGEESRYVKQLEYHFNLKIRRKFVRSEAVGAGVPGEIPKIGKDVETLRSIKLSASSLKDYLDCPARFYYARIAGLEEEREVSDALDAGMIGDVYHATMQALYLGEEAMDPSFDVGDRKRVSQLREPAGYISRAYLDSWLRRERDIKLRVRSLILARLHAFEVSGRNLVTERVIVQYVLKTLARDRELMDRKGVDRFEIVGLERYFETEFDGFTLVGFVDRMDRFLPGELRIVDYKTGKVDGNEVIIDASNAENIVELLFGDNNRKRPRIALQLFLYDFMAGRTPEAAGSVLVNSIYQPARLFTERIVEVPADARFNTLVEERLHGLLEEMTDIRKGWTRTSDAETCSWCPFKVICGR